MKLQEVPWIELSPKNHLNKRKSQCHTTVKLNRSEVKTLDHLGLVAGMYDELGLGDIIDDAIKQDIDPRKVSIGQAVKTMVRGGLGFVNQRRHDFPQFFQDKPVDRLIGEDIEAEMYHYHVMGRALDDIFDYGATSCHEQIAVKAFRRFKFRMSSVPP